MEYKQYKHYNNSELDDDADVEFDTICSLIIIFSYVIAIPLMIVTFIVYSILPELRNIHGLTVRGYIGCQLLALTTMLVMIIVLFQGLVLPCILYGFFYLLSLCASYLWLNVMCFDIWWTFRCFRPLKKSYFQSERKKYICYSIYVWSWAIFFTTIWASVEFTTGNGGATSCIASANVTYVFVPIGFTLFLNMILFILTVTKIIRHNKDTARDLGGTESRRNDSDKQWFTLYLKLFVVMGINWFFEMMSWIRKESKYIELLTNLIIPFQGVIVFILFICKKKILLSIMKRCRCWKPNSRRENSGRSVISRVSMSSMPPHDGIAAADSSRERF